ncbi:protein NATD1 [Austrofundulus limnaeus]|uniref:Protein NATD1 n=1 Tax=Austrofundulus limnaeus TaxID=52670 RepID=A0A2I4DB89_AUSLI|nr:PREDICTED: protein NATD1-like [Austrofundulus limnaeus]
MSSKIASGVLKLTQRVRFGQSGFVTSTCSGKLRVEHDRLNRRFTVAPSSGAGTDDCAVLSYRFIGEKEVDLMSTFVPETFRGHGIAALLSQAAVDFLLEENLKARVSCWYIRRYIEEQPQQLCKDLLIT